MPSQARRRWLGPTLKVALGLAGFCVAAIYGGAWLRVLVDGEQRSVSTGTPARGSIAGAHPIHPSGNGYRTYSYVGSALGRQYVHGSVRSLLVDAFTRLRDGSDHTFVIGETGWPEGGTFRPHRTHRNGLSVDIFVPLVGPDGEPTTVSCWPWNMFCYGLDFDAEGRLGDQQIDFASLAKLLRVLDDRSRSHGLRVAKVIIAPEYRQLLLDTSDGRRLGQVRQRILRRPVWVRHDDHIHIDFGLVPGP